MIQAVITSGFIAGRSSVSVTADVANGTVIRIYDDETKLQIGSGVIASGTVSVAVSPALYSGQRIIAYVTSFGNQTYGAIEVVESDTEFTGWKEPVTVDGDSYTDYLASGGDALPEIYAPEEKRNISRDKDSIDQVLDIPITFRLRQVETMAGTVQVILEDIQGAIGGFKTKFDADADGAGTTKTYSSNGSYQVKVWGANQTIADAILKTYNLVMPASSVVFGANVIDLAAKVDWGASVGAGLKAIILVAHSTVACEFQIDGLFNWEAGVWEQAGLAFRSNIKTISAGTYTIRARNAAIPAQTISRDIKLTGF